MYVSHWKKGGAKPGILFLILCISILGLFVLTNCASAEMSNSLQNEGCVTCHINYPGVPLYSTNWDVKHKFDVCDNCHTSYVANWMWNCRYCHLTAYNGNSGFRSYSGPLSGGPPGSGEFMNDHSWTGVDADFAYHNNTMGGKHTSAFPAADCIDCHQSSLTLEHDGRVIGLSGVAEDFEDDSFAVELGGDWARTNTVYHTGTYGYKSKTITHNQSSVLQMTVNLTEEGSISFWYKVSSEGGYDFLKFCIDGTEKLKESGMVDWKQVSYPLTAGAHTLKWIYSKDGSVSSYQDSAYIDDVIIGGVTGSAVSSYPVDCNSRHLSSDAAVKSAITNHNTGCSACHLQADHDSIHISGLNESCLSTSCHTGYLNTDHKARSIGCGACHNSNDPQVITTIENKDKYCGGCHFAAHNLSLVPVVEEIPLYPGFDWGSPMFLSIWQGEPWTPADLASGGYIILSDHRNITADMVWNFYKTEMASQGWVLGSAEPLPGAADFEVTFPGMGRSCVIKFSTSGEHITGISSDTESSMEIIYN